MRVVSQRNPARLQNAGTFADGSTEIRKMMEHAAQKHDVERLIGERSRLDIADAKIDIWKSLCGTIDAFGRDIETMQRQVETLEPLRKGACSAPEINGLESATGARMTGL